MLRTFLTGVMVSSLVPLAALGVTPDQARRETDQARQAYEALNQQCIQGRQQIQRLERDVDDARRRQNELPRLIDAANATAAGQRERITQATRELPKAQTAATEAGRAVSAQQDAIKTATSRQQEAGTALTAAKDRLTKQFLASDPVAQQAMAKLSTAQAKYDEAAAAAVESLAKTAAYQQAVSTADKSDEAVRQLRGSGAEQARVAEASVAWMKAKTAVEEMKQGAIARDPAASTARGELQSAITGVAAIKAKFERDLDMNAEITPLKANVEAEAASVKAARTSLASAQSAATSATARVREITSTQTTAQKALTDTEQQLARLNRERQDAESELNKAIDRSRRGQADLQRLEQDRQRAAQVLAQKQQQEDRVRRTGR